MPNPTLQELMQELQEQAQPSAKHQALIQALQNYDLQTSNFRETRGRKKLPLVTARDKTNLLALHQAIGKAAENVLGDENESKVLRDIVKKITALASGSHNALLQYDPVKNPKTLSSLEEDVRTLTIHQGNVVLGGADAMGGVQSERAPLSFLDNNGNRISGVFTKKKTIEPDKLLEDAFKEITEAPLFSVSHDAEAVEWLRDNFYQVLPNIPVLSEALGQDAEPAEYLAKLMFICEDDNEDGHYFDPDKLKYYLSQGMEETSGGEYNENSLDDDTWNHLAEAMKPMIGPLVYAHGAAKIPFGGRIDNRNAAMSAVADLLGMPNVIARSKPMKIIDKDGSVVAGTFMEASKGLDPSNLPPEASRIRKSCLKDTNGKGFKDIANLQVLDYLCGNFDRHGANMHYLFDKNGKLCGVQGIDNDSAFGVLTDKELGTGKENYLQMTNLMNLRVIPKETRDRVMALEPSTLKYALRGYGLTEAELKSAELRLKTMKTYIREAARRDREGRRSKDRMHLRVMSDSDFKSASLKDLCKATDQDPDRSNTFDIVKTVVPDLAAERKKQVEVQNREYKDLRKAVEVGMDNRAERRVPGRERIKGSSLEAILNKRTWSAWTSDNYIRMQRAVKSYVNTYKTIENRLEQANKEENKRMANYHHEKEAVVSQADLERMRQASVQMRDAAWTYLSGKMPELQQEALLNGQEPIPYPDGASDYTKRRIDAAVDVYRLARQGEEIKPVENQTARDNEREALAAQQKRQRERNPESVVNVEKNSVQQGGPVAGT